MENPAIAHGVMVAKCGYGIDPSLPFEPPGEDRAFVAVVDSHDADFFIDRLGHSGVLNKRSVTSY